MAHVIKSGSSVFVTGGAIIKVNDTITQYKESINIGINYPQFIEADHNNGRYLVASSNTIKIFDNNFNLLSPVITDLSQIKAVQRDSVNNRWLIFESFTNHVWAINDSSFAITDLIGGSGMMSGITCGTFDAVTNRFYLGTTGYIHVYTSTGLSLGIVTDSRLNNPTPRFLLINPITGYLMISVGSMILLADTASLLIQTGGISIPDLNSPSVIRFDPVNPNSYWIACAANLAIVEMSVGTNALKRTIQLINSTPYSFVLESVFGLYSMIISDAGYNQFYRLKESLV